MIGNYIYDLLLDIMPVLSPYDYAADFVIIGQQNYYKLPTFDKYIIITEINTDTMGRPNWVYDGTKETYNTLDYTTVQVDFYGENAYNASKIFRAYLYSPRATDYLFANAGLSLYKIDTLRNLSMVLDTGNYISRYTQIFTIFNNNTLELSLTGLTGVDNILTNVDGVSHVN